MVRIGFHDKSLERRETVIDPKSNYQQQEKPVGGRHILAAGETTMHHHAIYDLEHSDIFVDADGTLYLSVKDKPVTLKHEEHGAQTIEPGTYRIGRVREVDPFSEAIRSVSD
jgi:hypothetical protein